MANPARVYIAIWDAYEGDEPDYGYEVPPDYVYEISDPELVEAIQRACNPPRSHMQQPLVTRLDPIS